MRSALKIEHTFRPCSGRIDGVECDQLTSELVDAKGVTVLTLITHAATKKELEEMGASTVFVRLFVNLKLNRRAARQAGGKVERARCRKGFEENMFQLRVGAVPMLRLFRLIVGEWSRLRSVVVSEAAYERVTGATISSGFRRISVPKRWSCQKVLLGAVLSEVFQGDIPRSFTMETFSAKSRQRLANLKKKKREKPGGQP